MTNLFFKDIRGNFWSMTKVVGFVKDITPTEDGREEAHFLAILEGGMSTEITQTLYSELTSSLITLEAADPVVPEVTENLEA